MFGSPALELAFTLVFAVTGLYSLFRLVAPAGGDRVAELAHLLMSVAMLGMPRGLTGGPESASGVVQLAVFGLLGAWFLAHRLRTGGPVLSGSAYHVVALGSMVWMVAAMPALMGTGGAAGSGPGGHEHDGHGATAAPGPDGVAGAAPSPWIQVVTIVGVLLLAAAAAGWAARAVRPGPVPAGTARLTGPRPAACCHVLMSLGMAGMLLAML
jgi:hypothetical protein